MNSPKKRFCVYVLYSSSAGRFYVGQSSLRGKRQRQHRGKNQGWTRLADDWQEVHGQWVESRADARILERRIKGRGARRYLEERGLLPPGLA